MFHPIFIASELIKTSLVFFFIQGSFGVFHYKPVGRVYDLYCSPPPEGYKDTVASLLGRYHVNHLHMHSMVQTNGLDRKEVREN